MCVFLSFFCGTASSGALRASVQARSTPPGEDLLNENPSLALSGKPERANPTATSCNPSPTFPHLHSQRSRPWLGLSICGCLSVCVCTVPRLAGQARLAWPGLARLAWPARSARLDLPGWPTWPGRPGPGGLARPARLACPTRKPLKNLRFLVLLASKC